MPLGARDMLLVIRAKDQASRTIHEVGRAIGSVGDSGSNTGQKLSRIGAGVTAIGAGIGAVGAAGIAFFSAATEAAKDYDQQARLTLTQIDGQKASLAEIKQIGRDVAAAIPAPFEQMQASLFDIFSSMDVSTKDAKKILGGFAKAAVAGATDVQTAGRATISIMNGFGLEAKDLSRILDVQFQLVRKGVGTYEEFASGIGRAIPSAARLGQPVEQLAGGLAFLTRNGLSVAQATTSMGRAFDALSKSKVGDRLQAMGITVRDSKGEYRDMVDIMRDLNTRMKDMTAPERAKALEDLFHGAGGTIQARRFFDLALTNFKDYETLVKSMGASGGAMAQAYKTMFESPANQMQLLKNNFGILREEIGTLFLPKINTLVEKGMQLIKWFNDLDPALKENIIKFAAIGAVIATVTGAILVIGGMILMFVGTLITMGMTVGGAIAVLLGIPIVIAAIGAAVFLVVKHFDTLKAVAMELYKTIADFLAPIIKEIKTGIEHFLAVLDGTGSTANTGFVGFMETLGEYTLIAIGHLKTLWEFVKEVGVGFSHFFEVLNGTGSTANSGFIGYMETLGTRVLAARDAFIDFSVKVYERTMELVAAMREQLNAIGEIWSAAWGAISNAVGPMVSKIVELVKAVIGTLVTFWNENFHSIYNTVASTFSTIVYEVNSVLEPAIKVIGLAFQVVSAVVGAALVLIVNFVTIAVDLIVKLWNAFGDDILRILKAAWELVFGVIRAAFQLIMNIIKLSIALFTGDWKGAWDAILGIVDAVWDAIWAVIEGGFKIIWGVIKGAIDGIVAIFHWLWDTLVGHSIVPDIVNGIIDWFAKLPGKIWEFIKGMVDNVIVGFGLMVMKVAGFLQDFFHLIGSIKDTIFEKLKDAHNWLVDAGANIIKGLIKGLKDGFKVVKETLGELTDLLPDWKGPKPADLKLLVPAGRYVMEGFAAGISGNLGVVRSALRDASDLVRLSVSGATVDTALGATGPVSMPSSASVIHIGNISIDASGSGDPVATATEVRRQLQELILELRQQ